MKKQFSAFVLPAACLCSVGCFSLPAYAAETKPAPTGWQTENGRRYYYEEGEKTKENRMIDGVPYVFAPNGVQQIGWQTYEDKRYYYDADGQAVFGWIEWRGGTYFVSKDKGKLTGEADTGEDGVKIFDEYGVLQSWQQNEDGKWSFADATGEIEIEGIPYLFDEDGFLQTEWQTAADGVTRYYDAETHSVKTGWLTLDGKRFYADEKKGRLAGKNEIDGKQYYFMPNGEMATEFYNIDGVSYYFGDDGVMRTGFVTMTDGIRYFNAEGAMQTGLVALTDGTYYFAANGLMQTGLTAMSDGTRYFNANGIMQTGFIEMEDGKHYFGENGLMYRGMLPIGNNAYYFNQSGVMQTGWQDIPAPGGILYRYYFDSTGARLSGWQTVGGVQYYFDSNGILATAPCDIGGKHYLFNSEGRAILGWYTDAAGKKYYGGTNGEALTGWQEIGNAAYYFYTGGVMAVSTTVEGYTIDANGVARNQRAKTADTYIANSNKTVNGVYASFYGPNYYSSMETPRTTDQLINAGWDKLVDYTFKYNRGVCYYLAAALDFVFQRAGFTTRIVYAWHNSHHYWVQVLIDGKWWNYDPTYRYQRSHLTWEQQNAADIANGGVGYTLRGYVKAEYDKRGNLIRATYTPA